MDAFDDPVSLPKSKTLELMSKRDLIFRKPLMNAAGMLGFAPDFHAPVPWDEFGAFVTNPLSLRPRVAASQPALIEYPGGFLLHTGLPNPGLNATLKKYARRWSDSPLPLIVHLMADRPEETKQMVQILESVDNVMAVELGFAPLLADDILLLTLEMSVGELPLIFCLPSEQVLSLGPRLIDRRRGCNQRWRAARRFDAKWIIRFWPALRPIVVTAIAGNCSLRRQTWTPHHRRGRSLR